MPDRLSAIVRRLLAPALLLALSAGVVAQSPGPAAPIPTERDARRVVLRQVLAQPEFQQGAMTVLVNRLRQYFVERLLELWTRLGGSRLGGRSAATAFAWGVGLLALAALTWWLLQTLARGAVGPPLGLTPGRGRRRSAGAWARAAAAAWQAGDAREAARCAYHAALTRLEDEGAWRQDETRTPREYLRLLPASHHRRSLMSDVVARFERAWYGRDAVMPEDVQPLLTRLEELGCLASARAS